jgi:competence protein ComEC
MVALLCFGLIRGLLFLLPEKAYHLLTLRADPKKIAAWLTLPLVIFYTLLAGGQVATIRSLIMIAAGLAAVILDREHALMHSLALAALGILLASPQALFDISFQLSYLSVLVIGYVVSVWNDTGIRASTRTQRVLQSSLLLIGISLATGLATGPLAAFYFNQFSLAGVVANLFVVPFAGAIVVPLGLFSGVLSLFAQELPLAWLNQFVADAFIRFVAFFARLPLAEFRPPAPGLPWLFCYVLFFLASLQVLRTVVLFRFKPFETSSRISLLPKLTLLFTGTALLLGAAFTALPKHRTAVSFPDVGQGDCALVELASGRTVLIDGGGTPDNRFDIGRRVVGPFLWNRGIRRLDLVVLSHPHPDHMNGLLFMLEKFDVREVWVHGLDTELPGYEAFRQLIAKRQIPLRVVSTEDAPVEIGGAEVSVLHPAPGFMTKERKAYAAENSRSLVLRISERGKTYLFSGDVGADAEAVMIQRWVNLKCDVLKVPHHGSRSSSSEAFVASARPGFAVAMVGRENPYRHPADEVVARYEAVGTRILRTDRDGAVTVTPNGDKLDALRWSELELRRITLTSPEEWKKTEQQNWKRLWARMTRTG